MVKKLLQAIKIEPPSTVEGLCKSQFVLGGSCGLVLSVFLFSGLITYGGVATSNPYLTWLGVGFVLAGAVLCWCIARAARRERRFFLGLEELPQVRVKFNTLAAVNAVARLGWLGWPGKRAES